MDRVTTKMIETAIEVLNEQTGLTYRYDVVMNWHTVYCEGSRMAVAHNKRDMLAQLHAIQQHNWTLIRMKKLS